MLHVQRANHPAGFLQQIQWYGDSDSTKHAQFRAIHQIPEEMTKALNEAVPGDEPDFLHFRRVPTDLNVLIHGILLGPIPKTPTELDGMIKEYFKYFHRIDVASAKFLKAKHETSEDKRATSIVVRLPEADAAKVTPNVVFMGKRK